MDETFIIIGGEVKATGPNRLGGYLVRFGSPDQPDTSHFRDFFTAETDFGFDEWPVKTRVLFHHGLDRTVGTRRIGMGELKMTEEGVWIDAILREHDEWARMVLGLAEQKSAVTGRPPVYWSSGTARHLVRRDAIKSEGGEVVAHHVREWPLGIDASVTHTPAEPRCEAIALKSLLVPDLAALCGPGPRSLAEETEQWLDAGGEMLARYRQIRDAELKVGRKLSAARRERLEAARQLLDDLLAETALQVDDDPEPAPETGAPANGDPGKSVDLDLLRIRARTLLRATGRP